MSKPVSSRFDRDQRRALQEMVETGVADDMAEAVRIATRAGLVELGYNDDDNAGANTRLRAVVRRGADASSWAALFLAAFAYFGPLEIRLLLVPMLLIPLSLYAADRALSRLEPRVSRAMIGFLETGETT